MFSLSLTYNDKTGTTSDFGVLLAVGEYLQNGKFPITASATCLTEIYRVLHQLDASEHFLRTAKQELGSTVVHKQITELADFLALQGQGHELPVTKDRLRRLQHRSPHVPVNVKYLVGFDRLGEVVCDYPTLIRQLTTKNSVVAGGYAVLSCNDDLIATETSDIDVWIYGTSKYERATALEQLETKLLRVGGVAGLRGDSALTFSLPHCGRNIQLILTNATSPLGVILSFDIDVSRAYLQPTEKGLECLALPETLQAWEQRLVSSATSVSPVRLAKMKYRGFTVAVDYESPPAEELTRVLTRNYIHNLVAPWSQIKYCMATVLDCTAVWSQEHPEERRQPRTELYGSHGLDVGYNPNTRTVPTSQYFKLTARLTPLRAKYGNGVQWVQLTDYSLPTELVRLDKGHCNYTHFHERDRLDYNGSVDLPLVRGMPQPRCGLYEVELHYQGVRLQVQTATPLYEVSGLQPV